MSDSSPEPPPVTADANPFAGFETAAPWAGGPAFPSDVLGELQAIGGDRVLLSPEQRAMLVFVTRAPAWSTDAGLLVAIASFAERAFQDVAALKQYRDDLMIWQQWKEGDLWRRQEDLAQREEAVATALARIAVVAQRLAARKMKRSGQE